MKKPTAFITGASSGLGLSGRIYLFPNADLDLGMPYDNNLLL
ncbi:MAG: hypothetical protein PHY05_07010 [Methanothrix sp.]|nr:hypothetical protein [Methanothrix sp.]